MSNQRYLQISILCHQSGHLIRSRHPVSDWSFSTGDPVYHAPNLPGTQQVLAKPLIFNVLTWLSLANRYISLTLRTKADRVLNLLDLSFWPSLEGPGLGSDSSFSDSSSDSSDTITIYFLSRSSTNISVFIIMELLPTRKELAISYSKILSEPAKDSLKSASLSADTLFGGKISPENEI